MNIGAWDAAYRVFPDYDYYVFLQDECVLIDPLYQEKYISKLSTRSMGMTGECINPKWNSTWDLMRQSPLNYPIKSSSGEVITDRISNYLHYFRRWGIDPGETGSHLRSLTWGFTSECLRAINGFPIGLNKEQCIAAEIGVSRKVASLGFEFGPVSDSPFACFRHQEWRADGFAKDVRSQDKKQ
jgi:hypothetical protein